MFHTKFILFAAVALLAVGCAFAIIGGQDAARGQFPYYAYLNAYKSRSAWSLKRSPKYRTCGGALISNQWLLTAAQCLVSTDGAEVHLGMLRLWDKSEDGRQIFNVTKNDYFIYPTYKKDKLFVNDIGLIKLPSPAKISNYVQTIPLSSVPPTVGNDVITTGYGIVKTKVLPQNLQFTKMKTIDMQKCVPEPQTLISKYSVVCANGTQTSLCVGDVGSPLTDKTGKLIGVAIFTWRNCALGLQQGFTGIFAYTEWIDGVIEGAISRNGQKFL